MVALSFYQVQMTILHIAKTLHIYPCVMPTALAVAELGYLYVIPNSNLTTKQEEAYGSYSSLACGSCQPFDS